MKILFYQGTPVPLRHALVDHSVATAYEMGWADLTNGHLLQAAEEQKFELLVTTDKNLRYQQNLTGRTIAIFVLPFTSWPRLRPFAPTIARDIEGLSPGDFVEWEAP